MKTLILILIYISLAIFFFCLLSGIAYMFSDYAWKEITTTRTWQFVYVILHWVPCGMIVDELSDYNYFK